MKIIAAEPGGIDDFAVNRHFLHPVFVAAPDPFLQRQVIIKLQSINVSAPHFDRRMMFPAAPVFNGPDDLISLYPLLPKAAGIECFQGFFKVGVG